MSSDRLLPAGKCWDCGAQAEAVCRREKTRTAIGWQCACGRYWPALDYHQEDQLQAGTTEPLSWAVEYVRQHGFYVP